MASIISKGVLWSVPLAVAMGVPMYSNTAGIISVVETLFGKEAALGHRLGLYDVGNRPFSAGNDHSPQGTKPALIGVFVAVVSSGILLVGFLFNLII